MLCFTQSRLAGYPGYINESTIRVIAEVSKNSNVALRLKSWLERFAEKPQALWLLFLISFIEASIFPISVDVPLIALGVASPRKSLVYGAVATLGSFLGGYVGYLIGFALFERVGRPLLSFYGMSDRFMPILHSYHRHGIGALIVAGYTPLPYIAFTFGAGFDRTVDLWTLTFGAIIGRTIRFMPVGAILFWYGPRAKTLLAKYSVAFSVIVIIVIALGVLLFRWLL